MIYQIFMTSLASSSHRVNSQSGEGAREVNNVWYTMINFSALNIEFALDEGLANPGDEYMLYYSERLPWWVEVTVTGQPGHGSQFIPDSAGERLRAVIDRFMDYRQTQKDKMEKNNLPIGEVTTVNLTMLQGGVQYNVVPAEEYFQKYIIWLVENIVFM